MVVKGFQYFTRLSVVIVIHLGFLSNMVPSIENDHSTNERDCFGDQLSIAKNLRTGLWV